MRCGTKCFVVTYETEQETKTTEVQARSAVEARKMVRLNCQATKVIRLTKK